MKLWKQATAAALLISAIGLAPALTRAEQDHDSKSSKAAKDDELLGTWRLVSFKYGDAKEFTQVPKDQVRLKHITPTHFEWVAYDAQTKVVLLAAGGRRSSGGAEYSERLDYGLGDDVKPMIGQKQTFHDKVDGDRLHHSGTLSSGVKIDEIWERVKGGD